MRQSKVYLVTKGQYSDYQVVGVFSSEEDAEKFCALYNGALDSPYTVEEYDLDPGLPKVREGLGFWIVDMERNGRVYQAEPFITSEPQPSDRMIGTVMDPILEVKCWARDREHAVKIANDIRTQRIASNRWSEHAPAEPEA